jgi:penicillin-binding protein-related factor A (putative recombinase)
MQKSKVDYSGGGKGFAVRFDAKSVDTAEFISLSAFKANQVKESLEAKYCGYRVTGFLIYFRKSRQIFFLDVELVADRQIKAQYHDAMKRFTIEDCKQFGTSIPILPNGVIDWYPALVEGK